MEVICNVESAPYVDVLQSHCEQSGGLDTGLWNGFRACCISLLEGRMVTRKVGKDKSRLKPRLAAYYEQCGLGGLLNAPGPRFPHL